uniref:Nucleotide exchange factor SIL1 n=1 Tax=Glossina palpalis gambiensis TaxID=67801 RepID=A0A1B0C5J7_9MUSC
MELLLQLAVCVLLSRMISAEEIAENTSFIATKEWKEIKEGQGIPAGLHVRINLQTGKKEAKLITDNEEQLNAEQTNDESKNSNALITIYDSVDEEELKNSSRLRNSSEQLAIEHNSSEIEKIKNDYKSYKELRKTYEGMRKHFKTDAEIIVRLIEEFGDVITYNKQNDQSRLNAQLKILTNFNYLMSQYDNALTFVDQGGLERILLPLVVNQTHLSLKVEAMRVLGAMAQNNPKVQVKVYEKNFGPYLTQILLSSSNTEELSSALYALGSLLRKFPHAQQKILSTSGTQALVSLLGKDCELKIKAKAITLISDVVVEKQLIVINDDPVAAAQYAELNFPERLKDNWYCQTTDKLMTSYYHEFLKAPDLLEYFIHALESTEPFCNRIWGSSEQLYYTLNALQFEHGKSNNEYCNEVADLLRDITKKIRKYFKEL